MLVAFVGDNVTLHFVNIREHWSLNSFQASTRQPRIVASSSNACSETGKFCATQKSISNHQVEIKLIITSIQLEDAGTYAVIELIDLKRAEIELILLGKILSYHRRCRFVVWHIIEN
jgi:hypothetical protein